MTDEAVGQQYRTQDQMQDPLVDAEQYGYAPQGAPQYAAPDAWQYPAQNQAYGWSQDAAQEPLQDPASYAMQDVAPDVSPEQPSYAPYDQVPDQVPYAAYDQAPSQPPYAAYDQTPDQPPYAAYDQVEEPVPAMPQEPLLGDTTAFTGYPGYGQRPMEDPVRVRTITVRTGRLVCDIEIPDARFRYTTPRLSAFANGQYPDLPHHACVNDVGNTFGYVMERTSVAHLLEHLTISEQVRNRASSSATFVGTTEWIDENAGLARIEVGFKDDLVALRAFNDATRFLNMAVLTCLA